MKKHYVISNSTMKDGDKKDPMEPTFVAPDRVDDKDGASDSSTTSEDENAINDPPPLAFLSLFRYSTTKERLLMCFALCCAIVTGFIAPANTLIFARLMNAMVKYGMSLLNPDLVEDDFDFSYEIQYFAIANAVLGSIHLVFTYLATMIANYTAHSQIFRIRKRFMEAALNQDIAYYDLNESGDFATRMTDDLLKLEGGIGENVTTCCHFWMSFLSCVILALVRGWKMALVCLSSFPITLISVGAVGIVSSKLAKQESTAYGLAGSIAEEVLSGIRTVLAFGGQEKEKVRYTENLIHAKDINIKRGMFTGLGFGILWFCIYGTYALSFWYGVTLVTNEPENYDVETMVAVFFGVLMGSMNFGISTPLIETFGLAKGAGAKIYSIIENIPTIDPLADRGAKPSSFKGDITFRDVHFNYPSRPDVNVLQGINLQIKTGQTVAIVGSSGCGKSTCIQLVQRFYDPMEGNIYFDNNNLKDLSVTWLRKSIGVVGQEPVLFNRSIYDNIRYGKDDATKEEIERAAKQANAHDFVKLLPKGYDTLVGERGTQLSGGQKQRIAIARALVRNPKILLLDEATSALDNTSERKVQIALDKASQGRTTIIVAHRLSTIRGADVIVVLDQGRVIEQGTHKDLLDLKGHYHKLVTAQLSPADSDYEFDIEKRKDSMNSLQSLDEDKELKNNVVFDEDKQDVDVKPLSLLSIAKLNAQEWKFILVASIGALIVGGSMPVFSVLFGNIIAALAGDDPDEIQRQVNFYCILFVVLGTVIGSATFLMIYMYGIAGEKMTMRLRSLMFEAMLRQEIAWFDDKSNSTGALCARLSGDAGAVQGATGQRIGTIVQSAATLLIAVVLALYYQWKLGLVSLCFAPFMLIFTYLDRTVAMSESFGSTKAMQKSTQIAVDLLSNIRTVVSLGREKAFCAEFAEALTPAMKKAKINTHYRGLVYGVARGLMFFAMSGTIFYGGYLIINEGVSFELVLKVTQVLMMSTGSVANALAFTPNLQKGIISASRIVALINRVPNIKDAENSKDADNVSGAAKFDNVTFSYPTRSYVQVLKGLDLDIQQGQTVALVGTSGCGKSTCIQLLERFYDPDNGEVLMDDNPIKGLKVSELRKNLGIVSQEPTLFDRTIGENIAYGDNSRHVNEQEIMDVAKQANIHNFIVSLPTGYDTRLGTKGAQLSGGQKQRVAIARALLRKPKLLLLDEATSALDTESEKVVQEALDNARQGRTCITIAHRLSTVKDADKICVFSDGVIAEMGTHYELMDLKGLYYKLQTQNIH